MNGNRYWEEVSLVNEGTMTGRLPGKDNWEKPGLLDNAVKLPQPTEERTMELKKATLIDGRDADQYGINTVLDMIADEETAIERLNSFKTSSKAIKALVLKHKANVKGLVAIIDAREPEEEK